MKIKLPQGFQNFLERRYRWVIVKLNDFRVTGRPRADGFVCRVRNLAAGVTGPDSSDALNLLKDRFDAPETPSTKSRRLRTARCRQFSVVWLC